MTQLGNHTRMDLAAFPFQEADAVLSAPPTLAERIARWFNRPAPIEAAPLVEIDPGQDPDPYIWVSVADLIDGGR